MTPPATTTTTTTSSSSSSPFPSKYFPLNLTFPLHPKNPPHLLQKTVTSPLDIPTLATVNDRALDADKAFTQWMAMFTERTDHDNTVKALTEALGDEEYCVVKAVVSGDGEDGEGEKIVGFVQWFCGWIVLEKVDPFAARVGGDEVGSSLDQRRSQSRGQSRGDAVTDIKDVSSNVPEQLAAESTTLTSRPSPPPQDLDRARRLEKGELKYIETRNQYIGAIRGKRHMFIRRIMVLPEYQGMGIGRKLMQVVTDEADRLRIVCWLFARPMGVGLYERCGFRTVAVTDMDEVEEGFECAETKAMMRGVGG